MRADIEIKKEYLTVREVATFWRVPLEDIRYLGEEGQLEICIRKIPIKVAIESFLLKEPYSKMPSSKKDIIKLVKDPQPLHPTDIYLLFANKDIKIKLSRLKTNSIMQLNKIQSQDIMVGFEDMIITASERKRFEFEKTNKIISESLVEPLVLKSSDFMHFELYSEEFHFGQMQASVIKELYDKYYAGDPWVHGKILLRKAESESFRIGSLFKKHVNWRKAVISDGNGYYRINLPFSEPAPTRKPKENEPSLFD